MRFVVPFLGAGLSGLTGIAYGQSLLNISPNGMQVSQESPQPPLLWQPHKTSAFLMAIDPAGLLGQPIHTLEGRVLGVVESVIVQASGEPGHIVVNAGITQEAADRRILLPWGQLALTLHGSLFTRMATAALQSFSPYTYPQGYGADQVFQDPSVQ